MFRKPPQSYIDSYVAAQGGSSLPTPLSGGLSPRSALTPRPGLAPRKGHRIFYELQDECPAEHAPDLNVVPEGQMLLLRSMLQFFCISQIAMCILVLTVARSGSRWHDHVSILFTHWANLLCVFAALCGLMGVCRKHRGLLLFFYINQLWSLSNVVSFFVMYMQSTAKSSSACTLMRRGDISARQAEEMQLDCGDGDMRKEVVVMVVLLLQLWISCFLAKMYSEKLQDSENDDKDKALIKFIWDRRVETWKQLRRFEDSVQRQFEELRGCLLSRSHGVTN